MGSERNVRAEWHADQADELLCAARLQIAPAGTAGLIGSATPEEVDRQLRAAQAHALTALALRKVGGR